jgi:hypothetical protein
MEKAIRIDKDLADAALDILGIAHHLPFADRNTAMLTSSADLGGLGVPSSLPLGAHKAAKGLHRLAHHTDPCLASNLKTSATRTLLEDGSLDPTAEHLLPRLQMPQWLALLKDLGITTHGSGDPPTREKELLTLDHVSSRLFTPVESPRLQMTMTISMAPTDAITFAPTSTTLHSDIVWPIRGSASIYAAIDMAGRQKADFVLILDNERMVTRRLFTKEGRKQAEKPEDQAGLYALDQTVQGDRLPTSTTRRKGPIILGG